MCHQSEQTMCENREKFPKNYSSPDPGVNNNVHIIFISPNDQYEIVFYPKEIKV